jgi:hypothetical protein
MIALSRQLPATFVTSREGLRSLACYVVAPARKTLTGRIGLRAIDSGFGTPVLPDGSRIVVRGDRLIRQSGDSVRITSVQAAADFLGVPLSSDPGVGSDLPPFVPDSDLRVVENSALALGTWYGLAESVLGALSHVGSVSEAQLWPEHFDLAVEITLFGDVHVNVGFSPGDRDHDEPYVYVGPHDMTRLSGAYWNASFGAVLDWADLLTDGSPANAARAFIAEGIGLLRSAE